MGKYDSKTFVVRRVDNERGEQIGWGVYDRRAEPPKLVSKVYGMDEYDLAVADACEMVP